MPVVLNRSVLEQSLTHRVAFVAAVQIERRMAMMAFYSVSFQVDDTCIYATPEYSYGGIFPIVIKVSTQHLEINLGIVVPHAWSGPLACGRL